MQADIFAVPLPTREVDIAGVKIGADNPLAFIAGPCVIEGEKIVLGIAEKLAGIADKLNIPLVFKASFDKANRSSINSFRGIGMLAGLKLLGKVRKKFGLPVLTDIHLPEQAEVAAEYVDALQIPAFLCRQTDLLLSAGKTQKPVNIKKGQFLAPEDIRLAFAKVASTGNENVLFTERGTSFGYRNLVVDFRSIAIMQRIGSPVIFDAGHSVQRPTGAGEVSGGDSSMIPLLARAAVAAGVNAVFVETHPEPEKAKSDGANSLPLDLFEKFARQLKTLAEFVRNINSETGK